MESSIAEQKICVKCGFCCDGTLFSGAVLEEGEKDNLPPVLAQAYDADSEQERFILPCPAFDQKCTIYNKKRAKICAIFRCKLLSDFLKNRITLDESINIVKNAKLYKSSILAMLIKMGTIPDDTPFWKLPDEIKLVLKNKTCTERENERYKRVLTELNILNLLLIKHFKSSKEFDKLMK